MIPELHLLQEEFRIWHKRNFPDSGRLAAGLAVAEEAGELCRAILKQFTGYRGTYEEWDREIAKEIGDVMAAALWVASVMELDAGTLLQDRIEQLLTRDWISDPIGHGLPK